jgi:hypothetical protein
MDSCLAAKCVGRVWCCHASTCTAAAAAAALCAAAATAAVSDSPHSITCARERKASVACQSRPLWRVSPHQPWCCSGRSCGAARPLPYAECRASFAEKLDQ